MRYSKPLIFAVFSLHVAATAVLLPPAKAGVPCTGGDVIKPKNVCSRPATTCDGEQDFMVFSGGGSFTIPTTGININVPTELTQIKVTKGCKADSIEAERCPGYTKETADPDFNGTGTFNAAVSSLCDNWVSAVNCETEYANVVEYWVWAIRIVEGRPEWYKRVIYRHPNPFPFPIGCRKNLVSPMSARCTGGDFDATTARYTKECVEGELEDRPAE